MDLGLHVAVSARKKPFLRHAIRPSTKYKPPHDVPLKHTSCRSILALRCLALIVREDAREDESPDVHWQQIQYLACQPLPARRYFDHKGGSPGRDWDEPASRAARGRSCVPGRSGRG